MTTRKIIPWYVSYSLLFLLLTFLGTKSTDWQQHTVQKDNDYDGEKTAQENISSSWAIVCLRANLKCQWSMNDNDHQSTVTIFPHCQCLGHLTARYQLLEAKSIDVKSAGCGYRIRNFKRTDNKFSRCRPVRIRCIAKLFTGNPYATSTSEACGLAGWLGGTAPSWPAGQKL